METKSSPLYDYNVIFDILLKLDYDNIIKYCSTYKLASKIQKDEYFWKEKSRFLGVSEDLFNNSISIPDQRYLQLASLLGKDVSVRSLDYISMDEFVKIAIKNEKWTLLEYAVKNNFNNWELALINIAKVKNKYYLDLFLNKSGDYQAAAIGAIKGKHIDLFKHLYLNAPKDYRWNYSVLIAYTLNINHADLVTFIYDNKSYHLDPLIMLEILDLKRPNNEIIEQIKILMHNYPDFRLAANAILIASGHMYVMEELTSPENLEFLLTRANSNIYVVKYLLSLAKNYNWDWSSIMGYNMKLYDYIKTIIPKNYVVDLNTIAESTIMNFDRTSFEKILFSAPNNYQWNWQRLAGSMMSKNISKLASINGEDVSFFDYIMSFSPNNYVWDWNKLAYEAIDKRRVFEHIIAIAPKEYQWNWNQLLMTIISYSNLDFIKYVLSKIPDSYHLNKNLLMSCATKKKYIFKQLFVLFGDVYIYDLIKYIIKFDNQQYNHDILEYILSNNKLKFEDYVKLLSKCREPFMFDIIERYIPGNFDRNKLIENVNFEVVV